MAPAETYQDRHERSIGQERRLRRHSSWLSRLRGTTVILTLAVACWLATHAPLLAAGAVILGTFIFIGLVILHESVESSIKRHSILGELNRQGGARQAGEWGMRPHNGSVFLDRNHPYAWDLDLFGPESVFQWLNEATTPMGRRALADVLTHPPSDPTDISARQEAVHDLADRVDWRQSFCVEGLWKSVDEAEPVALLTWAADSPLSNGVRWILILLRWLPPITLSILLLAPGAALLGWIGVACQLGLACILHRHTQPTTEGLAAASSHLDAASRMLRVFEDESFSSRLLTQLQEGLRDGNGGTASRRLRQLKHIAAWMAVRHNREVSFFANAFLLWDLQFTVAADNWRRRHGSKMATWLRTLGMLEELTSFARVSFDHPKWSFPEWVGGPPQLRATGLGHPLLAESERVTNDFVLGEAQSIAILTGSNMTGKSTWLRTVGINLVMARCGSPACADSMRCTPLHVITSMRTIDSLASAQSTFIAELKRIRHIVDMAASGRPMLFLVDEMFSGTNSNDRQTCSVTLLHSLAQSNIAGMMATHDIDLSRLADARPDQFINYHFTEHIEDQRMSFDYRLHPGPSTTTNAEYLMRSMGVLSASEHEDSRNTQVNALPQP